MSLNFSNSDLSLLMTCLIRWVSISPSAWRVSGFMSFEWCMVIIGSCVAILDTPRIALYLSELPRAIHQLPFRCPLRFSLCNQRKPLLPDDSVTASYPLRTFCKLAYHSESPSRYGRSVLVAWRYFHPHSKRNFIGSIGKMQTYTSSLLYGLSMLRVKYQYTPTQMSLGSNLIVISGMTVPISESTDTLLWQVYCYHNFYLPI